MGDAVLARLPVVLATLQEMDDIVSDLQSCFTIDGASEMFDKLLAIVKKALGKQNWKTMLVGLVEAVMQYVRDRLDVEGLLNGSTLQRVKVMGTSVAKSMNTGLRTFLVKWQSFRIETEALGASTILDAMEETFDIEATCESDE